MDFWARTASWSRHRPIVSVLVALSGQAMPARLKLEVQASRGRVYASDFSCGRQDGGARSSPFYYLYTFTIFLKLLFYYKLCTMIKVWSVHS